MLVHKYQSSSVKRKFLYRSLMGLVLLFMVLTGLQIEIITYFGFILTNLLSLTAQRL